MLTSHFMSLYEFGKLHKTQKFVGLLVKTLSSCRAYPINDDDNEIVLEKDLVGTLLHYTPHPRNISKNKRGGEGTIRYAPVLFSHGIVHVFDTNIRVITITDFE